MKVPLSIAILLLVIILVIQKKYLWLTVLCVISLFNDLFHINIKLGPSLPTWSCIALFLAPTTLSFYYNSPNWLFRRSFKYIFFEYFYLLLLGLVLGILFPWESSFDAERLWNQRAEGRTFISLIRLFSELLLILYFYFIIAGRVLPVQKVIRIICVVASASIILGVFDYFMGYQIKQLIFNAPDIPGRFTAFSGEPRVFGRKCSFVFLLSISLVFSNYEKPKFLTFYIVVFCSGVILSMSASAITTTCLWFLTIILLNVKKMTTGLSYFILGGVLIFTIKDMDIFKKETLKKMEIISEGEIDDKMPDEPEVFTRFEVFDRAAINFLYFNPSYLFFGTGPNLISIPASDYISPYNKKIYEDKIDSVPHMGSINILARSGLIGVFLYLLFTIRLYKANKKISPFDALPINLLIGSMVFFALILDQMFYVYIGLVGGLIALKEEESLKNETSHFVC